MTVASPLLAFAARATSVFIGTVFVVASISKVIAPSPTIQTIDFALDKLPFDAASSVARWNTSALAGLEFALGTSILARIQPPAAHAAATICLLIFLGFIIALVATKAPVGCGCALASSAGTTTWNDASRTGVLLAVAMFAWRLDRERSRVLPSNAKPVGECS